VKEVTAVLVRLAVCIDLRRRKEPLPSPVGRRAPVLTSQGVWQFDETGTLLQIGRVQTLHPMEVLLDRLNEFERQHGCAILRPFSVPDNYLSSIEVDILHTETAGFEHAKSGSIHQGGSQPGYALEPAEYGGGLLAGEYDRQVDRSFGTSDFHEIELALQDMAIEED